VRRWRVAIEDIEIENHTSAIISPFVKFIIGGDYYVSGVPVNNQNVPSD